jgi:hypothetical protein
MYTKSIKRYKYKKRKGVLESMEPHQPGRYKYIGK